MALTFGVASLVLGTTWSPHLVSLVVAWALAIALGSLVGTLAGTAQASDFQRTPRSWQVLHWPHFCLAAALIAVNAYLSLAGNAGYAAQVTLGRTTPTGILGYLALAAPTVTIVILLNSLSSKRGVRPAIALTVAQAFVLALSGFRGAAGVFIIAIVVGAALILPRDSAWRSKSRLLVVTPVIGIVMVATLVIGAQVKSAAADAARVSSEGTQVFTLHNAVKITATRLQLGTSLETALKYQGDTNAKDAVSWVLQLQAGIPRVLWPAKPDADYGQRVSVAMYGLQYGQSSSTVTTIGDCLLNFGLIGISVAGLLLGFVFRRVQVAVSRGRGGLSVLVGVVVVYSVLGQEAPLVLILVGIVRDLVMVGVLWVLATLIAQTPSRPKWNSGHIGGRNRLESGPGSAQL